MFVGPVFAREAALAPRRLRLYVVRTAYVGGLLVLMSTAWWVLTGTQLVRDLADMAEFGAALFAILAPLQLALALFFSGMLAAGAVAHEKDRGTLVLLLLTHLRNSELVLGTLFASLLGIVSLLAASAPVLMLCTLFGGVSGGQVAAVLAVTLATVVVAGSIGSTVALAREKTFQSLAMTVLAIVVWLGLGEAIAGGLFGAIGGSAADVAAAISPWRAVLAAAQPRLPGSPQPLYGYLLVSAAAAVVLNGVAIVMVRRWNRAADAGRAEPRAFAGPAAASSARAVWDNPVLWREIRTRAYGRRIALVRLAYLAVFAAAAVHVHSLAAAGGPLSRIDGALALAPIVLLSLVLVNAQAVTSLTSERDVGAMDLLLVTDLTPNEIVLGKLAGAVYNAKEIILLPLLLVGWLWQAGPLGGENALYVLGVMLVLYAFAATLGLHAGMSYGNSRTAIGVSLGTVFFLFVGVATCMRIMAAFSGSFQAQLQPFLAVVVGGGAGMYLALGARNPSGAIALASFVCPLATFYAIASFLMDYTLAVFLVMAAAYGFMTAAMLVPAISEFDVATGRTTAGEA